MLQFPILLTHLFVAMSVSCPVAQWEVMSGCQFCTRAAAEGARWLCGLEEAMDCEHQGTPLGTHNSALPWCTPGLHTQWCLETSRFQWSSTGFMLKWSCKSFAMSINQAFALHKEQLANPKSLLMISDLQHPEHRLNASGPCQGHPGYARL